MNRQEQFILEERQRTCQVRIKPGRIVEGHSGGNVVWMTPARARLFLDQGAVEIVSMPKTLPGPDETKEGTDAGKSSGAPTTGHSTGSAPSNPSGEGVPLSASEVARLSAPIRSSEFERREPATPAELSQSTTHISSRRGQTSSTSRTRSGGAGTTRGKSSRGSKA